MTGQVAEPRVQLLCMKGKAKYKAAENAIIWKMKVFIVTIFETSSFISGWRA